MRRYLISLKTYMAIMFGATFCALCAISTAAILFFERFFELKLGMFWGVLSFCALEITLGGAMFYVGSGYFLRYVESFRLAAHDIAKGDFSVRVARREHRCRGKSEYLHELDELAANINLTAAALEKMDYMQRDFISNVSHELKTPLSVIGGFCELARDERDEARRNEYLDLISEQATALSELCENMLLLSRLDSRDVVNLGDEARVDEQLRRAVFMLMKKHPQREFELNLAPVLAKTAASMLMQVWLNLIDNALKYSNGKVKIQCREEEGCAIVAVKDEGAGIEAGKLDKIYDKFYQCEESHKSKGSGLGLSIVKRVLELLGGEIEYESEPGRGTTARVKILKAKEAR